VSLAWSARATLQKPATGLHSSILSAASPAVELICAFGPESRDLLPTVAETREAAAAQWKTFWTTGGAIDLSESKDPRWKELGALKEEVEKIWLPAARRIAESQNKDGKITPYSVSTVPLPDKVSGWNESYYKSAGDEYVKGTQMTPNDVFLRTRFRNMRWEGGDYVLRSKPYVVEHFVKPEPAKQ
jgi:hypothetical protein